MKIFEIIILILSVISTSVIPLIFALKKAKGEFTNAQNDADKQKSIIDMIEVVRELIEIAEKTYTEATGKEKKRNVLTELKDYADTKNYSFDSDYWSTVIDDLVLMTKNVNVNQ